MPYIIAITLLQIFSMLVMIAIFLRHCDASSDHILRDLAIVLMVVTLSTAFIRRIVLKVASLAASSPTERESSVGVKTWASLMWWGEMVVAGGFVVAVILGPVMNLRPL
jgi:hypothetical protein